MNLVIDIITLIPKFSLPICGAYVHKPIANDFHAGLARNRVQSGEALFTVASSTLNTKLRTSRGPLRALLIGDVGTISPVRADEIEDLVADRKGRIVESARILESHRSFGIQIADIMNHLFIRNLTRGEAEVSALVSHLICKKNPVGGRAFPQ